MARLTNYIRESIARSAINHAFDPKKEALSVTEDALACVAYAFVFSKKETDLVGKVPEYWFRLDSCLRFNVGGQSITLKLKKGLPVPYGTKNGSDSGYHCHNLGVIPHGDLCDRIQAHAQALEAYKEQRRGAERQVKAMLDAVTTTGKLKEVWPEGEQFYSVYDDVAAPKLPALRVDEINAMLGLASEQEAA